MKSNLGTLLRHTYSFSAIDRDIIYPDRERYENDAEHAFQLALLAWYIIEKNNLSLDKEKVFKLALAHDLVEIYSGDVPLWGPNGHAEKDEKERQAIEILKQDIPDVPSIIDAIKEYKGRETAEAQFVAGLDKLLPLLNQLNTEGKVWKYRKVSLARALEVLQKQAKISPYLTEYFDEAIAELKANSSKYFDVEN